MRKEVKGSETAPRLGIDIGRVIIDGSPTGGRGDTAFFDSDDVAALATPEVAGSVDAISRLTTLFRGQVWLVSKCGPAVQARTERWLAAHQFFERTGVGLDRLRFCRARDDKRSYCMDLCLTHFVDDQRGVHEAIRGAVSHQFLFGITSKQIPGYTVHVVDWVQAEDAIRASLMRNEELQYDPEFLDQLKER